MWDKCKYQIVIASILVLQLLKEKDQTGVQLVDSIRELTGGAFTIGLGSLLTMFRTLEEKGDISSYRKERGRFYHLEDEGLRYLTESLHEFYEVDDGIRSVLHCGV